MPYSYARFKRTLRIFLKSKVDKTSFENSFNILHTFGDIRYAGSTALASPGTPRRLRFDNGDNDSDDDEYAPDKLFKKIPQTARSKAGNHKRKADGDPDGEKAAKSAKKDATAELSKEERLSDFTSFLTLGLTSLEARDMLKVLAQQHQNDVTKLGLPTRNGGFGFENQTYLERLDEEALQIDNDGGKALRNRKVPDPQKCRKCKRFQEKCICHEVFMPRNEETERRRLPSIVPITPKIKDFEPRRPNNPSAKGKERVQSPTPVGLMTPPSTGLRSSDSNSPWRDSSSTSEPPSKTLVLGKQFFHEGDETLFIFDPVDSRSVSKTEYSIVLNDPGEGDETFQIVTRWSHPIDFQYLPKICAPCKFCTELLYGITGEIQRAVLVYRDPAIQQYIEVASEMQVPRTRMCISCALSRRYITACPGHRYAAFKTPFDHQLYIKQITRPKEAPLEPGEKPARDVCSICPLPADFYCCAEQTYSVTKRLIPKPNRNGCGLRLCKRCRIMMTTSPDGKLHLRGIKRYFKSHKSNYQQMTRADVEFICEGRALQMAFRPRQ